MMRIILLRKKRVISILRPFLYVKDENGEYLIKLFTGLPDLVNKLDDAFPQINPLKIYNSV